jgi:short-subunit dehydrogenase involved in D-alanine esterification of teichoic acids
LIKIQINGFFNHISQKFQELRQLSSENPCIKLLEIELKNFDKYPEIAKQVEAVVKDEGLTCLFNNAGISPRASFHGIPRLKVSELMETFEVNCVAPLMLTKVCIFIAIDRISLNKIFNRISGFLTVAEKIGQSQ